MATTITPQSLVVTLSEVITLNGQPINSENSFTVPVVNEIDKRILTVPSSEEISIINLDSATSAGTFIRSNIRYIRIVNKDSTNFMRNINNKLRKNYRILSELNVEGKSKTTRAKLLSKGFDFEFFTNILNTKSGNTYYFLYDQGYLPLENDIFMLVKKDI